MNRGRATFFGFGAILLWALLAVLTVGSAPVPPFQLSAICFSLGGGLGLVFLIRSGKLKSILSQTPLRVWALGVGGLFGYHALYFSALRLAPAAEAGLIAYLWPLLIVLFSGLLPGEKLRLGHIAGALLAFWGAGMLVLQGGGGFDAEALPGYGLALLCALTWSGYSVLSRRAQAIPTETVALFCLAAAGLSGLAHLGFEQTYWPISPAQWLAILGLGAGPVGLAFYLWDFGVKRGDIQMLGVASYAAPLLSTFTLVAFGYAAATSTLIFAAALITAGAAIAAYASSRAS
ncbi:MAG: EamA family transporter [Litoreibacter sp.]|nr:EamA family transporter [Litoreibacter sp.]